MKSFIQTKLGFSLQVEINPTPNKRIIEQQRVSPSIKDSPLKRSVCDRMVSIQVAHRSHEEETVMLDVLAEDGFSRTPPYGQHVSVQA